MSTTLTDQDRTTLRTAAYGAVSLIAAASGKPHKAATNGAIALNCATGTIGHVLAAKPRDVELRGKTVAELADQVLPALTAARALLEGQHPAEADDYRTTVLVAVDTAARTHRGDPAPAVAELTRKITAALDAARPGAERAELEVRNPIGLRPTDG